jgi:hypothetical protein
MGNYPNILRFEFQSWKPSKMTMESLHLSFRLNRGREEKAKKEEVNGKEEKKKPEKMIVVVTRGS